MNDASEEILSTLTHLRADQGLTQADVARTLNVTQGTVSAFERGNDPLLSTLLRYAAAIGVHVTITFRTADE